jgi:hypothetical protein
MVTIVDAYIFLGFEPRIDFLAEDYGDGNGPIVRPENWFSDQPQPAQAEIDSVLVTLPLSMAKQALVSALNAKCEALIVAGQVSDALGTPHLYPSKLIDQNNLAANVQRSTLPVNAANPQWETYHMCRDQIGVWAFRLHTASQIQQAGEHVAAKITAIRMVNAQKQAEVMSPAFTLEDAGAYNIDSGWPSL